MTENANIGRKCEKCGALLAADVPEGLCPRCLMALNLATQTEAPEGEIGPDGTQVVQPKPEPPPPLEEIARHFPQLEILECMGRGGMGVVYKARQPRLNRLVAIKILAREKEKDQRFAERFTREAQSLARLNHPNIVTVYDFGEAEGLYYLLMEYVDGMNLRQLLQSRRLAPEEALTIVPAICEALQYAHQQGIVHRDVKPENILMDKQGRVKIADFGIAKLLGADSAAVSLTGDQQVVGTPHYMAPEQVEKPAIVDHRADIYSLGVVFYEMLTGELPLGKFAPPSKKVHMDVRLDEVVLHALEKEPERRYQQASQVKTDVETIARSEAAGRQTAPPRVPPSMPVSVPSGVADALRQVKGPGTGLVITAIVNWVAIPFLFLIALLVARGHGYGFSSAILLAVPLSALVVGSFILTAGLMMKRLQAYWLAVAGSIIAILVSPGNLIGLPIGIWALVVLSQRHVREAFGRGQGMVGLQASPASGGGGGWKVAAVIAATVLLLLAIPVGAIITALGLAAQNRATAIQAQVPTFVVQGTVTDAATGQPIAGARVDDSAYGARPNRSPQQAWTDAQGHFRLRTWREEHTLAASAAGYETKLQVFTASGSQPRQPAQMDFQLQPAADAGPVASAEVTPGGATVAVRSGGSMGGKAGPDLQALDATVRRGREAWDSGEHSKAFGLLLAAATQGHPVAQHRVGVMYAMGQGVEQDWAEATRWFRKAAEQGQGEAQYSMGMRYLLGQSVVQDEEEAVRWFKPAADQGVAVAQATLALRYAKGEGVPQDDVEAYKWATLARSQGAWTGVSLSNLEQRMTREQIVEAKRRAKEFVPKRVGPADP